MKGMVNLFSSPHLMFHKLGPKGKYSAESLKFGDRMAVEPTSVDGRVPIVASLDQFLAE
jgi:hypothetical protein